MNPLAYYLELILRWLIARVGEQVMGWTLRQVVEYFTAHPEEAQTCAVESVTTYTSDMESDSDPYFWERKH